MEVDDFQKQVSKFQRVSSNGSSTTTTDNSQKIATHRGILESPNHVNDGGDGGSVGGGSGGGGGGGERKYDVGLGVGGARLCGWPTSRIVRVSRASGGKDRHSKVLTSKGLRDRRVRLSVSTAIQFYDLQDRLGCDQPSKAVDWLLKAASSSIEELPSLDPPFTGGIVGDYCNQEHNIDMKNVKSSTNSIDFEDPGYSHRLVHNNVVAKSPACSSTSETSKGSGLSLSNRSENRIKARERAREMVSKKEKDKETEMPKTCGLSNPGMENPSFTDLLTGGITNNNTTTTSRPSSETRTHWTPPQMDYFFPRNSNPSAQLIQIPQFNTQQNQQHQHHHQQHHQQQHFAFLQDGFLPAVAISNGGGGGGGESYNLNFSVTPLSSNGNVALAPGFSRGTLQSNLPSTLLPHHSHLQRFQSSSVDGSTSANMPFFIVPNPVSDHFPGGYHLSYGNGSNSDQHKEKSKH